MTESVPPITDEERKRVMEISGRFRRLFDPPSNLEKYESRLVQAEDALRLAEKSLVHLYRRDLYDEDALSDVPADKLASMVDKHPAIVAIRQAIKGDGKS